MQYYHPAHSMRHGRGKHDFAAMTKYVGRQAGITTRCYQLMLSRSSNDLTSSNY
jgi:hypothetical protein